MVDPAFDFDLPENLGDRFKWGPKTNEGLKSIPVGYGVVDGDLVFLLKGGEEVNLGPLPPGPAGPAGGSDAATAEWIETGPETTAALSAKTVSRTAVGGFVPPRASSVTTAPRGTTPRAVEVIDGYVYGSAAAGTIYRRPVTDDAAAWEAVSTLPNTTTLRRLVPTADGEVIALGAERLYKSTGWGTGTITWTLKATPNTTCTFMAWGIDGDGTRFITTEYSGTRADSRYVRGTTDAGETWTVVYDSVAQHGATLANGSHLHGCAYDPYADRWYISEGHDDGGTPGQIAGLYCSTDDWATWQRADGMAQNPAPTVLVATRDGLVVGSDNVANGMYGVRREDDPAREVLRETWRWRTGRDGLLGFPVRGFTQPDTDVVYMSWTTAFTDVAPIITAGTVESGELVWTWPTLPVLNSDSIRSIVITDRDHFLADATINGVEQIITGSLGAPGARSSSLDDGGNIFGGVVGKGDSLAVGKKAVTGTGIRSTAVGVGADTAGSTQDSSALGYGARVTGTSGTAAGSGARAHTNGTAIGHNADTGEFSDSTVYGQSAKAAGASGTAVGRQSESAVLGVAVGHLAKVAAARGIAIGYATDIGEGHANSVAFYYDSTAGYQMQVGERHLELTKPPTAPGAPADGGARFYAWTDANGNEQLVVRFNTGSVQVIASQTQMANLPAHASAPVTAAVAGVGGSYFNTTLGKPLYSDGTVWRDATGTAV